MEGNQDQAKMNYIAQMNAAWDKIESDADLKPTSIVVYFALLQINNLSQWKTVFKATFGQVLNMTGIGNVKTYYSALEELVKNKYIVWNKSSNQHKAATFSIIQLYQKTEEQSKSAMPKKGSAMEEHTEEQGVSTRKSKGNILKPINNKLKNKISDDPEDSLFEKFWDLYPSKVNKKKCQLKWKSINESDRALILNVLPAFLKYKPFETYTHPHPLTFLNNERWNDVITSEPSGLHQNSAFVFGQKPVGFTKH